MAISAKLLLARENPSGLTLNKLKPNIDPNTEIIKAKQDIAIRAFKILDITYLLSLFIISSSPCQMKS